MRRGVDIQVHFVNGCPGVRVTVLLVFILLHFSRGSGRYLVEPYHTEEFTQNHTDVTQPQLLTAFNWIIRTVCSIIIFHAHAHHHHHHHHKHAFSYSCFSVFHCWTLLTVLGALCAVLLNPSKRTSLKNNCHLLSSYVMNRGVCIQIHICYCNSSTDWSTK